MFKNIKNWKSFNESEKSEDVPNEREKLIHKNFYPIDDEDLLRYLATIEDSGYSIIIEYGFINSRNKFTFDMCERELIPCVQIKIYPIEGEVSNYDATNSFRSFFKRIKRSFADFKIYQDIRFYDEDSYEINDIKIENGIYNLVDGEYKELVDGLMIHLKLFEDIKVESIKITDKDIFDYYSFGSSFNVEYDEKGCAIIDIPVPTLTNWFLDNNDDYIKIIDGGANLEDLGYYDDYYLPDHDSFFEYDLDDNSIEALIRCCFKNFEEIKDEYPDCDFLEECESLEELVEYVKSANRSDYNEIGEFLTDNSICDDLYDDIRRIYSDNQASAKMDSDYKKIIECFDTMITHDLNTNIVKKHHVDNKNPKMNPIEFYKIEFNIDWIDEIGNFIEYYESDGYLEDRDVDLETYMQWYISQFIGGMQKINPYFNDYGDVDKKDFNKRVMEAIPDLDKS
jgi:hypothetical protein